MNRLSATFPGIAFRAVRALIFCAALGAPIAGAQDAPLAGRWTLALESPRGSMISTLEVKDGAATLSNRAGTFEIGPIERDGSGYAFSYEMERRGQKIPVEASFVLEGDELHGEASMGGAVTMPLHGARAGTESELALRLIHERPGDSRGDGPRGDAGRGSRDRAAAAAPGERVDLGEFMGEWVVTIDTPSAGVQHVDFVIDMQNGAPHAEMKLPPPLGTQVIHEISREGENLKLRYQAKVGSQTFDVGMALKIDAGRLNGSLADEAGLFEIPFAGVRKGEKPLESPDAGDANQAALSGRATSRERSEGIANGKIGDARVDLIHGRPALDEPGVGGIPWTAPAGEMWRMGKGFATRMKVSGPFRAGGSLVEAGRYGLWARKGDGRDWHLVVNRFPDVWGTQHDPEGDVASVPFAASENPTFVDPMTIRFEEVEGGMDFVVEWGNDRLTARLEAAP